MISPLANAGLRTRVSPLLLLTAILSGQGHGQQETTFIGPENWPQSHVPNWSVNAYWSDGLPTSDSDVILPTKQSQSGNDTNSTIDLDTDATVNSFTLGRYTELKSFRENFFVNGTSTVEGVVTVAEAQFSLGDLAQFDPETGDLFSGPNFVLDCLNPPNQTILEFRNADIVSNYAMFQLFGPDVNITVRDQNTGLSAFLNFAHNHDFFSVNDGYILEINTLEFTNHQYGRMVANYRNFGEYFQNPAGYQFAGNLVNDGIIELYANSTITVAGGVSGSGSIKVLGLPCNLQVLADIDFDLGEFAMGGSGIDGFILKAMNASFSNGATVTGNGTMEANVTVNGGVIAPGNSPGKIAVKGNLTLNTGAILRMEVAGSAHDQILQSGDGTTVTLGGTLSLTTISDFDEEVLSSSTYTVLEAAQPLTGAFANVASGARVNTADGKGSFRVDYGTGAPAPNKVVLSDYIAVNAPQTFDQWIATQSLAAPLDLKDADPNSDGISNLEAYFRGLPAKANGKIRPIATRVENGNLIVSIRSPRTVTGVDLASRIGTNLSGWDTGPVPVLAGTTPTRNIYEVSIPISSSAPGFVRFEIEDEE